MRCYGGFDGNCEEKYGEGGMECGGGIKADFEVESSGAYVASHLTKALTEQMKDFVPKNIEDLFYPNDEALTQISEMKDRVGSKLLQFGGMMEAKWGCNVTIACDESGKFSKSVVCGFEGHGATGMHITASEFGDEITTNE